ncbi:MAG: efflux RND transporter periplasmic adaptor subunit [Prolixibacteraceae bacterium]|nr:efflux RND transporter periplasmic adaptor subunit [Prolixibacteraceae bacterium]MBN2773334.1 efflux RND transporter periplasmic adaptor subunit [Prolixibacteraceae bacterium]
MKKLAILITVTVFLASCASTTVDDEAAKRQQLQKYKQQVHDLEQKIEALETELDANVVEDIVNIKATEVQLQTFEHFIEASGNVEAEQDINVSPESIGVIEEVLVTEGMNVNKGQVLAKLNTDALNRSLDEMEIQLELAQTTFQRQKNLWDQNIGSEIQFLQAKTNKESIEKRIEGLKAQIEMAVVKSPIDGVVDIVYQKKGQIGSPQVPFAKVLNTSQLRIYADVSEAYLTKIKNGDKVKVNFPALNKEVDATIYRIGNTIDPNNRTFRIRINLNNSGNSLKPNLVSIIKMRDYVSEDAVVVPNLLIKEDFKGFYTYIVKQENGESRAKKVYVTPGISQNNITEVIDGIESGDKVITEGYTQVVEGTLVRL